MAGEEYAEHIPCLPLVPVSTLEDRNAAWDRVRFTSIRLDPDPASVFNAQKAVYNLEALFSLRKIDRSNVDDTLELTLGVIPEECQDGNNR